MLNTQHGWVSNRFLRILWTSQAGHTATRSHSNEAIPVVGSQLSRKQLLIVALTYSFVKRENRVPYYQRLFQRNDGVRQWNKVSRRNTFSEVQRNGGMCRVQWTLRSKIRRQNDFCAC